MPAKKVKLKFQEFGQFVQQGLLGLLVTPHVNSYVTVISVSYRNATFCVAFIALSAHKKHYLLYPWIAK